MPHVPGSSAKFAHYLAPLRCAVPIVVALLTYLLLLLFALTTPRRLRAACCVPDGPDSLGVDPVRSALSMKLLIFLAVVASIAPETVSFCSSFFTSCLAVGPSAFAFVDVFLVGELLNLTKPAVLREYA